MGISLFGVRRLFIVDAIIICVSRNAGMWISCPFILCKILYKERRFGCCLLLLKCGEVLLE